MTHFIARQKAEQLIQGHALPTDERSPLEKASDNALARFRTEIVNLLSPQEGYKATDEISAASDKWTVTNKWLAYARLTQAAAKLSHTNASAMRLQKAIEFAKVNGWTVEMTKHNTTVKSVEWTG
ncbi:MAG: hypothetical protein GY832_26175 [Chloroflexi bacterium]|nr:hypothetical protein [Chloroflexota bacterium]